MIEAFDLPKSLMYSICGWNRYAYRDCAYYGIFTKVGTHWQNISKKICYLLLIERLTIIYNA